jgi:hypothetical protein
LVLLDLQGCAREGCSRGSCPIKYAGVDWLRLTEARMNWICLHAVHYEGGDPQRGPGVAEFFNFLHRKLPLGN